MDDGFEIRASAPAEAGKLSTLTASADRLALCLSGGGFRAALFHLGALRRLNELGILSKIDVISAVSGGAILAAHLATQIRHWPAPGTPFEPWREQVEAPFQKLAKQNVRTVPLLNRLLPWNWFRPSTQVKALQGIFERRLTSLTLSDLPDRPTFIFCATDMIHGILWVFEKQRVGSYQAGYFAPAPPWPMATAAAASTCFPPLFGPMPIGMSGAPGSAAPPDFADMTVSDGALYDNLGLQPVESNKTVIVSDGGAPFVASVPTGLVSRIQAYIRIIGKQAGSLRKRALIAQFLRRERQGTYWGIASATRSYLPDAPIGYSKDLAVNTIARIRTDLDAFSEAEIAVLVNHGYLLADVAIKTHARSLVAIDWPLEVPYPDWMDEARVADALRHSSERKWLGRW